MDGTLDSAGAYTKRIPGAGNPGARPRMGPGPMGFELPTSSFAPNG